MNSKWQVIRSYYCFLEINCHRLDHEADPKREEQTITRREEGIPRESGEGRLLGNSYLHILLFGVYYIGVDVFPFAKMCLSCIFLFSVSFSD